MAIGTLAAATSVNARTAVDVQNGASPTPTDGDQWTNTGREYLAVYNPEASDVDCSIAITSNTDGVSVSPKVVTVPTLKTAIFGPFPTGIYNDTNGKAKVTCALSGAGALANVKLKLFKFGT